MNEKKSITAYRIVRIIIAILLAVSLGQCIFGDFSMISMGKISSILVDVMGLMVSTILLFGIAQDSMRAKRDRALARLITVMCVIMFFDIRLSFLEGRIGATGGVITQMKVEYALLGIFHALILYCYWAYIREEINLSGKFLKYGNIVCRLCTLISILLQILNLISVMSVALSYGGDITAGKHRGIADIVTLIIFALTILAIVLGKNYPIKQKIILLSFEIFPVVAAIVGVAYENYDYVYPSYVVSLLMIYINIFTEQRRKIAEQQIILEKQNTALMISQIQPHFLYNVLTTISNLCGKDPLEAQETTVMFSRYLRTNLDSLKKEEPVPFLEELDHIKIYVELEKKRFKSRLNVDYEIEDKDFEVPALGLQPLVENAVKHGICMKEEPGTVKISSKKDVNGHLVMIEDDGVGFDPEKPVADDKREHVGLTNTVSRLEKMCDAKVTIESSPGCGCKIAILFPFR